MIAAGGTSMAEERPVPQGATFNLRIHNFVINEYDALTATDDWVTPMERTTIRDIASRGYQYVPDETARFRVVIRQVCLEPHAAAESAMKQELRFPLPFNGEEPPLNDNQIFVWSKELQAQPRSVCIGSVNMFVTMQRDEKTVIIASRTFSQKGNKTPGCPFDACRTPLAPALLKDLRSIFP